MLLEEVSGFSFRDEILSEIQLLLLKSFIYLFFWICCTAAESPTCAKA